MSSPRFLSHDSKRTLVQQYRKVALQYHNYQVLDFEVEGAKAGETKMSSLMCERRGSERIEGKIAFLSNEYAQGC